MSAGSGSNVNSFQTRAPQDNWNDPPPLSATRANPSVGGSARQLHSDNGTFAQNTAVPLLPSTNQHYFVPGHSSSDATTNALHHSSSYPNLLPTDAASRNCVSSASLHAPPPGITLPLPISSLATTPTNETAFGKIRASIASSFRAQSHKVTALKENFLSAGPSDAAAAAAPTTTIRNDYPGFQPYVGSGFSQAASTSTVTAKYHQREGGQSDEQHSTSSSTQEALNTLQSIWYYQTLQSAVDEIKPAWVPFTPPENKKLELAYQQWVTFCVRPCSRSVSPLKHKQSTAGKSDVAATTNDTTIDGGGGGHSSLTDRITGEDLSKTQRIGVCPESISPACTDSRLCSVFGGRHDVDFEQMQLLCVFWDEPSRQVLRATWFYKGATETSFQPYDQSLCLRFEEEYQRSWRLGTWHSRVDIGNGEALVIHSPNAISHFVQPEQSAVWVTVPDALLRPRAVKRSAEGVHIDDYHQFFSYGSSSNASPIPPPPPPSSQSLSPDAAAAAAVTHADAAQYYDSSYDVDHLVFVVHGIGSVCDLKMRNVIECVGNMRQISRSLLLEHWREYLEQNRIHRVEYLPVEWHSKLHGDTTGVDARLKTITLPSIPKLRNFTNETLLDILFYTSPTYCETIAKTVALEINRLHELYRKRNPRFCGKVSIIGHSLGSLICFDLLANQQPRTVSAVATPEKTTMPPLSTVADNADELLKFITRAGIAPDSMSARDYVQHLHDAVGINCVNDLLTLSEQNVDKLNLSSAQRQRLLAAACSVFSAADNANACNLSAIDHEQQRVSQSVSEPNLLVGRPTTIEHMDSTVAGRSMQGGSDAGGVGQLSVFYPKLDIAPLCFFAIGSPIGMFLAVRGVKNIGIDYHLPTCARFLNIFHPYDVVAYRIEPLIRPDLGDSIPGAVQLPHHKGRKRIHRQLQEQVGHVTAGIKARFVDNLWSTLTTSWPWQANTAAGIQAVSAAKSDTTSESPVTTPTAATTHSPQRPSTAEVILESVIDAITAPAGNATVPGEADPGTAKSSSQQPNSSSAAANSRAGAQLAHASPLHEPTKQQQNYATGAAAALVARANSSSTVEPTVIVSSVPPPPTAAAGITGITLGGPASALAATLGTTLKPEDINNIKQDFGGVDAVDGVINSGASSNKPTLLEMGRLNEGQRVDYVLQESALESTLDVEAHRNLTGIMPKNALENSNRPLSYWDSEDTIFMILLELYGAEFPPLQFRHENAGGDLPVPSSHHHVQNHSHAAALHAVNLPSAAAMGMMVPPLPPPTLSVPSQQTVIPSASLTAGPPLLLSRPHAGTSPFGMPPAHGSLQYPLMPGAAYAGNVTMATATTNSAGFMPPHAHYGLPPPTIASGMYSVGLPSSLPFQNYNAAAAVPPPSLLPSAHMGVSYSRAATTITTTNANNAVMENRAAFGGLPPPDGIPRIL